MPKVIVTDRRIEDKLDAKGFSSALVSLRMAPETHGNRRLPLVYPAWIAVPDGVTNSLFHDSRMLVTERLAHKNYAGLRSDC